MVLSLSLSLQERDIERFLLSRSYNTNFEPWINPVTRDDYVISCRNFVTRAFTKYLPPGHRWGLKEIRYHSLATARFLTEMFPSTRFVVLRRDLARQCVSNVMAEWSILHLDRLKAGRCEEEAAKVVDECAYALVVIDLGLARIAEVFAPQAMSIRYETLLADPEETVKRLYGFAGLGLNAEYLRSAERILAVRSGSTPSESVGFLTEDFVRELAPDAINRAREAIDRCGIDVGRLRGARYSFLVGDHGVLGSDLSTMF